MPTKFNKHDAPPGYEAVPRHGGCAGCAFRSPDADCPETPCSPGRREDNTNVVFVKTQTKERQTMTNYKNKTKAQLIEIIEELLSKVPRTPKSGEVWLDDGGQELAVLADSESDADAYDGEVWCITLSNHVAGMLSIEELTEYVRDFDLSFGANNA